MNTQIKRAISVTGSQKKLAEAAGVSQPAVTKWLYNRAKMRAEHALSIEKATGGQITRYDLRPDIDWDQPQSAA